MVLIMRILLTGGGTAGHINPAISIAHYICRRQPGAEVMFAGSRGGLEEKLVSREGYEIRTVDLQGFSGKVSPAGFIYNIKTIQKVLKALPAARRLMREFKPDAVIGTGGYVCFPFLYEAAKEGIPCLIHESNAMAGKTTRMLEKYADKVMLGFADCADWYKNKDKLVVTGNPLREGLTTAGREKARQELGIDPEEKLVVSVWGSLGARDMNHMTAAFMKLSQQNRTFFHIHATGANGYKWFPQLLEEMGVSRERLDIREYIHNLPVVMQAADIILCRAGAMTVSEVCAAGLPSIIVPSPNVAANHQEKNARALEKQGAAVVLLEKDCTPELLYKTVMDLINDPERLKHMRSAAMGMAVYDADKRIYDTVMQTIREKSKAGSEHHQIN